MTDQTTSIKWYKSVITRTVLSTVIVLTILLLISNFILRSIVQPSLQTPHLNLVKASGQTILSQLEARLTIAETINRVVAKAALTMPSSPEKLKQMLPILINLENESYFIAGGGVWPEPFQFNKNKKRNSYFWARESDNKLYMIDDYNTPSGPGYHNEEWYVPTRHVPANGSYWSRSYVDPYSKQPMVTNSVPLYIDDKFIGVSTIDIRLDGMQEIISKKTKDFNGYAILIDQFNKIISLPKGLHEKLNNKKEMPTLNELVEQLPPYQGIKKYYSTKRIF